METNFVDGAMTIKLTGRIDSGNVSEIEEEIRTEISFFDDVNLAFDAGGLEYISSAGLRLFLKLKKETKAPIRVFNVSDEIYDIFSVTGFTEVLDVERSMRTISLTGCEKVSSALNGEIYGLSDDEIVKIYKKNMPLSEIKQERNYAQAAMVAGIPTLIPYDVVNSDKGYGIVYEKAGAQTLANAIFRDRDNLEVYAKAFANLLKEMHSTEIPDGKLPDIKDRYRQWFKEIGDYGDNFTKTFSALIDTIPDRNTYVHGDIDLNSVMIKDDELLVFDMAGSARGHSLFDLQGIFASLVAIERTGAGYCRKTFGLSGQTCLEFWKIFFREYMNKNDKEIEKMNELLLKYFVLKEKVLNGLERKNQFAGE
ncbi:MAG: STAS domain-containing protein [Lachnospiraceae bacterium]|nr:STAS domain-containing protein [Lachnospiraceae bacterium]